MGGANPLPPSHWLSEIINIKFMAKEEKKILEEVEQEKAPSKGDREKRWEAFLANAKALNPVKFALKEERGEFKNIPDSFR